MSALERAIDLAASDIADSIDMGRSNKRRAAMREFLKMAIWHASSSAESIPSSAWVNLRADDAWLKTAKEKERFNLPETLTDKQFREICNKILGIGNDQLEAMIPPQLKMNSSLEAELSGIVGPSSPSKPESLAPPLAAPSIVKDEKPDIIEEKKIPQADVENILTPPKRPEPMKRDKIAPPVDEFQGGEAPAKPQ
jgi:hypothetical protein